MHKDVVKTMNKNVAEEEVDFEDMILKGENEKKVEVEVNDKFILTKELKDLLNWIPLKYFFLILNGILA